MFRNPLQLKLLCAGRGRGPCFRDDHDGWPDGWRTPQNCFSELDAIFGLKEEPLEIHHRYCDRAVPEMRFTFIEHMGSSRRKGLGVRTQATFSLGITQAKSASAAWRSSQTGSFKKPTNPALMQSDESVEVASGWQRALWANLL